MRRELISFYKKIIYTEADASIRQLGANKNTPLQI